MVSKNWLSSVKKWEYIHKLVLNRQYGTALKRLKDSCGFCKHFLSYGGFSASDTDCLKKCPLALNKECLTWRESGILFWELRNLLECFRTDEDKELIEIYTKVMLEAVLRNEF